MPEDGWFGQGKGQDLDALGIRAVALIDGYMLSFEEAQSGFAETKTTLFPDNQKTTDGLFGKIRDVNERTEAFAAYLKLKSSEMAIWTIKPITGYIFQKNLQSSLRDDLERLLLKGRAPWQT